MREPGLRRDAGGARERARHRARRDARARCRRDRAAAPVMRVARSYPGGDVRIEQQPDPEPAPGEVVCQILACGVCASDVTEWYVARKLPAVLGHEPAGVVSAIGEGVSSV